MRPTASISSPSTPSPSSPPAARCHPTLHGCTSTGSTGICPPTSIKVRGMQDPSLPRSCAHEIADAFARYNAEFRAITRRAPLRFDARDAKASQKDAVERIDLYDRFVNATVAELKTKLGEHALDRDL